MLNVRVHVATRFDGPVFYLGFLHSVVSDYPDSVQAIVVNEGGHINSVPLSAVTVIFEPVKALDDLLLNQRIVLED